MFPSGANAVPIVWPHLKRVLWPEEEESAHDREHDTESEGEDVTPAEGKNDYIGEFIKVFLALDSDAVKLACTCQYKYGENDGRAVDWVILTEEEEIMT